MCCVSAYLEGSSRTQAEGPVQLGLIDSKLQTKQIVLRQNFLSLMLHDDENANLVFVHLTKRLYVNTAINATLYAAYGANVS